MRVLIVDDEAPARRKMRRFVDEESDWEVIGEARSVASALAAIEQLQPELVLLDIQLGDGSGFDVLDSFQESYRPRIVFITAYDEYAVQAFEVHAQDYLLKPVERSRFRACVDRINNSAQPGQDLGARLDRVLRQLSSQRKTDRIYVEQGERGRLLPVDRIDRIQSDRNCITIHAEGRGYRLRRTLQSIVEEMDPERFVQINRSTLIQLDAISEVQPWFRGDRLLILRDGSEVRLSRSYFRRSLALRRLLPNLD